MKNLVIVLFAIFLSNCAGYKPIFSPTDIDFNAVKINYDPKDKISKKIEKKILNISNDNGSKQIEFILSSKKEERILSKDKKGNPLIFEISITTNLEIIFDGSKTKKYIFNERFNYNNQSDKFELAQQKKISEKIILERLFEKILDQLRLF